MFWEDHVLGVASNVVRGMERKEHRPCAKNACSIDFKKHSRPLSKEITKNLHVAILVL